MAENMGGDEQGSSLATNETSFDELEQQFRDARKPPEPEPKSEEAPKPDPAEALAAAVERLANARPPVAPAAAPVTAAPAPAAPAITEQDLRDLYDKDPVQGIAAITQLATQQAEARFNQRLSQLTQGNESIARSNARDRYKTEFELFGSEIDQHVAQIQDKALLANPATWDTVITYVRGQNMDKLIEAKVQEALKTRGVDDAAPAATPRNLPPVVRSQRSTGGDPTTKDYGLTAEQLRVCKIQGISPQDFKRYGG